MKVTLRFIQCLLGMAILSLCGAGQLFAAEPAAPNAGQKTPLSLCTPEAFNDFDFSLTDHAAKETVFKLHSDGILEITGKHLGYLATKKAYKNFTLRGEFSLADEKTNGGLLCRITGPSPTFLPRCVEIQVMANLTGDLFGFHGLEISGPKARFESGKKHQFAGDYTWVHALRQTARPKVNDWNTIEVTCLEDFIIVRVNEKVVNWAWNIETTPGPVAFQSEGGGIRWRNVTIVEE